MSQGWEYLRATVEWSYDPRRQRWTSSLAVARSVDGAVEAREANVEAEFSRVEFMNALGAEGWELVSETVDEVWVGAERRGITGGVSTPVRTCWTFKRPRE